MSFAVADVIGKGIPAALAMSMIKFSMDSYGHSLPSDGLKRLNRVVEKNISKICSSQCFMVYMKK